MGVNQFYEWWICVECQNTVHSSPRERIPCPTCSHYMLPLAALQLTERYDC